MHTKIPFLAVLIISIFQIGVYGIQNNKHSKKDLDEILDVQLDEVTEVSMIDLSNNERRTTDPEQIKAFIEYFNQFQYQRLMNDQTGFMPRKAITVYFYAGDEIDFIIPYGNEAFISNKVYSIKKGQIEQSDLLEMFYLLPNKKNAVDSS